MRWMSENWVQLPCAGKPGHAAIALAPAGGIKTQALRFKTNRLTFALVTNHRFDDLAPQAERVLQRRAGREERRLAHHPRRQRYRE